MFKFIRPEFFDIFGIGVFLFIIFVSAMSLKTSLPIPSWALIVLLIIGILGFLVDVTIVYLTYAKNKTGRSLVGRAPHLQCGGHRFESGSGPKTMLLEKFDKFLQSVDLKSYREKYRPIKIVEMDLPKRNSSYQYSLQSILG